jgi:hypothetical protein
MNKEQFLEKKNKKFFSSEQILDEDELREEICYWDLF